MTRLDRDLATLMIAGGLMLGVWALLITGQHGSTGSAWLLASASLFCLTGGLAVMGGAR